MVYRERYIADKRDAGNAGCCNIQGSRFEALSSQVDRDEVIKMDKQQLREQLEQLHAELAQVKTLDSTEAEMLQRLVSDIREVLEREENHARHYTGLRERLKEAVARLEASHPTATERMRQVIDQLAYLGI